MRQIQADAKKAGASMTQLNHKVPGFQTVEEWKKALFDATMRAATKINNPRIQRSSTYIKYLLEHLNSDDSCIRSRRSGFSPILEEFWHHGTPAEVSLLSMYESGWNQNERPLPNSSNYAFWVVIINGGEGELRKVYGFLENIMEEYHYDVGVLINFGSKELFLDSFSSRFANRIIGIGIESLEDGYIAHST